MRKLLLAPLAIACTLRQQKNLTQSALRLNHFFQRVCMHARQRSPAMRMGVLGPPHATCLHMAYTAVITSILLLASIATMGVAPAAASNPVVIVEHVTDLGMFKGRHYVQVEGLMVATFPRPGEVALGSYSVPLIMAFPVQHEDDGDDEGRAGNRVGLVDVPNSADFNVLRDHPLTEENITQWALRATGDYLFREGYTYLAVQWSKTVTDRLGADPPPGRPRRLGYGVIERATDSTQILRDASRLLRHPVALGDLGIPESVEHVLAFGFSQTAFIVSQFINAESNQDAGGLFYDGFALSVDIRATIVPPSLFPADQGKIIALYTETDLQFFRAALNRPSGELDYYRHYELAGVAHLPKPLFPLDSFGATRQNPANLAPAQRAVIANLMAWIRHGDEPPPSQFIDGTILPDGAFVPERDADGNALGGLRLPHMPGVLCDDNSRDEDDCRAAGAPLGTYTGLETNNVPVPPNSNLYVMWGGTFEPFSPEELKERYGTRSHYVQLVRRAAQELRRQGYILQEELQEVCTGGRPPTAVVSCPPPCMARAPGDARDTRRHAKLGMIPRAPGRPHDGVSTTTSVYQLFSQRINPQPWRSLQDFSPTHQEPLGSPLFQLSIAPHLMHLIGAEIDAIRCARCQQAGGERQRGFSLATTGYFFDDDKLWTLC